MDTPLVHIKVRRLGAKYQEEFAVGVIMHEPKKPTGDDASRWLRRWFASWCGGWARSAKKNLP
jgi:hypothetical protein